MPILVHSVLFAACAAAGEDAMARNVSAAATSGNLHARVRDMVPFASAYLSRFLTVPSFIVARQMAGPMISDRCGFVARCARVSLSLLGGTMHRLRRSLAGVATGDAGGFGAYPTGC